MIFSLDIGTKIGYYKEGANRAYTYDLGKGDERFLKFYEFLVEHDKKASVPIKEIAFEAAAFQQGHAIPIYHGLVAILKLYCLEWSIPLTGIPVGTIKKTFTGKGNSNKAAIMAECDKRGMKYDDDNASDSYAVYCTYMEMK